MMVSLNSKTFKQDLRIKAVIVILFTVRVIGFFWIWSEFSHYSQFIANMEKSLVEGKKQELIQQVDRTAAYIDFARNQITETGQKIIREQVYSAHAVATHIFKSHKMTNSITEIKSMVREALRPARFSKGKGYFFATDFNGIEELFVDRPEYEGKNLLHLQDARGAYVIQDMINIAKTRQEGFYTYHWSRPGPTKTNHLKISFVKKFAPFNWFIGTGLYYEHLEQEIRADALRKIETIRFGRDGYMFVGQWDGTILTQSEARADRQANALPDKILLSLIELARNGGGFSQYNLAKLNGKKTFPKISYVRNIPEWKWIIGAGVYLDDVLTEVGRAKEEMRTIIIMSMVKVFAILASVLALAIWLASRFTLKVQKAIDSLSAFFNTAAEVSVEVDLNRTEYKEFTDMALAANNMLAKRKKAEQERDKTRHYLANIIDSMPSILVGVDEKDRVTQWNAMAEQDTGLPAARALGQPLAEVFPRLAGKSKEASKTGKNLVTARHMIRADGQSYHEDITVYPLASENAPGAVIRVDDVTSRVKMEEIMVQSEKMLSVGGMAAGLAHEVNNPLAGMIQSADLMRRRMTAKDLPANQKEAHALEISLEQINAYMENRGILKLADAIASSGHRISDIVSNMLNFAGKGGAGKSSHCLADLMDDIIELARSDYDLKKRYDFKGIRINRDYRKTALAVPCEKGKIQQVLLNILKNGAQAMYEAHTPDPAFTITIRQENHMAWISVADNGPGMEEQVRKRVFEPFFTTKPSGVGTGLGLSVSYFIITKDHKGKISLETRPGKGTTFIIQLPLT